MDAVETRKLSQLVYTDGEAHLQYLPNLTINELGKQLLKAATDGNVSEIRALLSKGAPFTADWLGTSPLHLAAQNNHLEACKILLRAGMSRDARTKVDRTPLHMAAYEGHLEIVECLLNYGADCDSKDLLMMTPLHWSAQNGHAEVTALLIRYGATTNPLNKFDLTPADIALQMNRPDIVQIINISLRDPAVATQHLALEMMGENSDEAPIEPIIDIGEGDGDVMREDEDVEASNHLADVLDDNSENSVRNEIGQNFTDESNEQDATNFSESMKLLQEHGITMLPVDESNILNSVMESGHSVVLTEAGKQALNSFKVDNDTDLLQYLKPKPVAAPPVVKKKKIITLTQEEFLAMTQSGVFAAPTTQSTLPNILRQVNGKSTAQMLQAKGLQHVRRITMKKNKTVPISPSINIVTKVQNAKSSEDSHNQVIESLKEQLQKAHMLIDSYKKKLLKSEVEAEMYKQQLKALLEQKRANSNK